MNNMSSISLQATQNEIIRQVLNTQDIHFLDKIKNLFLKKEADDACMVSEEPLAGFSEALKELKDYRDGKIELKPLDDLLNEL